MASAAVPPRRLEAPARSARSNGDRDQSRLLPVLAVERALRAVVLIGVGLILLTHTHTDWADVARRFAEQIGFDPSRNETGRLISRLAGRTEVRSSLRRSSSWIAMRDLAIA